MAHHGSVTDPSNLHRSYAWEYADATARTAAIGFVPVDVGKAARQLDTNTIWMLTDDAPITWVQIGGPVTAYTDEQVRDVIGAALVAGANVSIAVNDPSDTITIAATDTNTTDPEVVRDTIAAALVAGSGITITPNDPADTITVAATGSVVGAHNHTLADISDEGTMAAQAASAVAITGGSVTGITDLAIADGGTGASDAATARTNLGVFANPMTTQDDLIVGGAAGAAARLAKGSDGQVLTVDPATHHLLWVAPTTGFSDPLTTKGDLLTRSASATARQGVGTTGQVLTADASQANGIKWATPSGTDPPYPPSAYVKAMATTPVIIGALPFWNVTGTGASDDDTNGLWIKQTTGATSGNNSGAGSGSFAVVRRDWGAAGVWLSRFADVTNVRLWVGFFATSPTASDTPTVTMAAFRFSTAAGDTTWRAITADGAGGLTNTDTGVALSAGDRPLMEIRLGTTTTFFIGGALVASHTTNLPGPTTTMGPVSWITTLMAAAKTSAVGYIQVWPRGR